MRRTVILFVLLISAAQNIYAAPICQKEMNEALKKQGVSSSIAKSQEVSSEEYKQKRLKLFEEFKILASHANSNGLPTEGKKLAIELAFRESLGERYVTKAEYEQLKKLGYYNSSSENPAANDQKTLSFKEKIGKFFSNVVTLAKNVYNSAKGAVTGKYSPPPETQKLANDLKEFRKKFGIHEGDGFDLLINGNRSFDTIVSGENEAFRAFLGDNQVQAYEIRKDGDHPILVEYENNSCAIKKVVFIDKQKGSDWSSISYSYYTKNYCHDLSKLDSIKNQLTDEDPNEFKFRCDEQGANSTQGCYCAASGIYINPWFDACGGARKKVAATPKSTFKEFAQARDALPGVFYTRSIYDESVVRCRTVSSLESAADRSSSAASSPNSVR